MAQTNQTDYTYVASGSPDFIVPFPYLSTSEVGVTVDGAPTGVIWTALNSIQLTPAPAVGAAVRIRRNTDARAVRNDFSAGAPFSPRNINENNEQLLYAVEEAVNETAGTAAAALAQAGQAVATADAAAARVDGALVDSALYLRNDLADPAQGAALVGYTQAAQVPSPVKVSQKIDQLSFIGQSGPVDVADYLPSSFRAGRVAVCSDAKGSSRLATSLAKFYPAGAFVSPSPVGLDFVSLEIPGASFTVTGDPRVFRARLPGHTLWSSSPPVIGTSRRQAVVVDKETGRRYLDFQFYPGADYSCSVYSNPALPGTQLDIKTPSGSPAPGTVVVTLYYPKVEPVRKVFIDPVNGNDQADGTSFDWAKKTFASALEQEPGVIFVKPGVYDTTNWLGTYSAARDLSVQCVGGQAIFVSRLVPFSAWALHDGTTYVSTVGGSASAVGAADLGYSDQYGMPTFLPLAANLAACQSTPGTAFWDAADGRKLYVNLKDGRTPTSTDVLPLNSTVVFRHSAPGQKVHVRNCIFVGGGGGCISARGAGSNSVLIAEDCAAVGMYNTNAFDIKDVGLNINVRCIAGQSYNDGFNYTALNGVSPHFIEIDCIGYGNFGEETSNGSTAHYDCIGLRVNTIAAGNRGPGIVDVGNSRTYSVGCVSCRNTGSTNANGFRADVSSIMYLDKCCAFENQATDVAATGSSQIKVRGTEATTVAGNVSVF